MVISSMSMHEQCSTWYGRHVTHTTSNNNSATLVVCSSVLPYWCVPLCCILVVPQLVCHCVCMSCLHGSRTRPRSTARCGRTSKCHASSVHHKANHTTPHSTLTCFTLWPTQTPMSGSARLAMEHVIVTGRCLWLVWLQQLAWGCDAMPVPMPHRMGLSRSA